MERENSNRVQRGWSGIRALFLLLPETTSPSEECSAASCAGVQLGNESHCPPARPPSCFPSSLLLFPPAFQPVLLFGPVWGPGQPWMGSSSPEPMGQALFWPRACGHGQDQ